MPDPYQDLATGFRKLDQELAQALRSTGLLSRPVGPTPFLDEVRRKQAERPPLPSPGIAEGLGTVLPFLKGFGEALTIPFRRYAEPLGAGGPIKPAHIPGTNVNFPLAWGGGGGQRGLLGPLSFLPPLPPPQSEAEAMGRIPPSIIMGPGEPQQLTGSLPEAAAMAFMPFTAGLGPTAAQVGRLARMGVDVSRVRVPQAARAAAPVVRRALAEQRGGSLPRIQVRAGEYRGRQGFNITGTDTLGRRVGLFVDTREEAEAVRVAIKAGKEPFPLLKPISQTAQVIEPPGFTPYYSKQMQAVAKAQGLHELPDPGTPEYMNYWRNLTPDLQEAELARRRLNPQLEAKARATPQDMAIEAKLAEETNIAHFARDQEQLAARAARQAELARGQAEMIPPATKEAWQLTRREYEAKGIAPLPPGHPMMEEAAIAREELSRAEKELFAYTGGSRKISLPDLATRRATLGAALEYQPYTVQTALKSPKVPKVTKDFYWQAKARYEAAGEAVDATVSHERQVRQALAEGKPVPPEVLKDYPELVSFVKPPSPLAAEVAPETMKAATPSVHPIIRLRPGEYQGNKGWMLDGREASGRPFKAFAGTRKEADAIRDNVKAGRPALEGLEELPTPAEPVIEVAATRPPPIPPLKAPPGVGEPGPSPQLGKPWTDVPPGITPVAEAAAPPPGGLVPPVTEAGHLSLPPESAGNKVLRPLRPLTDVRDEVVGSENPVVRALVGHTGINPSVLATDPVAKTVVAYHRQSGSIRALVENAMAPLDAFAQRFTGISPLPIDRRGFVQGTSKLWQDVFSKPDNYPIARSGTPFRQYIDTFNSILAEMELLRVEQGLKPRGGLLPDGTLYVPRQVKGIRGVELRRPSNPSLQRIYEEATQGEARGVVYDNNPRATLGLHLKAGYRETLGDQLGQALEPFGVTPSRLIPEPVRLNMETALKNRMAAERLARKEVQQAALAGGKAPMPSTFADKVTQSPSVMAARQQYFVAKNAYSKAMEAARKAEVAPGALFGKMDETVAIGQWRNRIYPREMADALQQGLGRFSAPQPGKAGIVITSAANLYRTAIATTDFGTQFIQGQLVLAQNPATWARATGRSLWAFFDPTVQARYLERNMTTIQEMARYNLVPGDVEFFAGARVGQGVPIGAPLKLLPGGEAIRAGARTLGRQTVGRFQTSYDTFLAVAKTELWKSKKPGWTGTLDDLAASIRNMTGALDPTALGVGPNQRAAEALWLSFSPRFFRSSVAIVSDAVGGVVQLGRLGTPTARQIEAIKTLGSWMAGGTMLYVAAGMAMQRPKEEILMGLNPLNGKKFLSYKVGNDWIGIGGQIRGLMQLNAVLISALVPGGKPIGDILALDVYDNPFLAYYRSRAAPGLTAVSMGAETLSKGQWNLVPGTRLAGAPDLVKHLGQSTLPFAAQAYLEQQGAIGQVANMLGGRTSPATTADLVAEWGKSHNLTPIKEYEEIPTNPAEREAKRLPSREAYRTSHPDVDAQLFLEGKVLSLQTPVVGRPAARAIALQIIRDMKIDYEQIPGVKKWRKDVATLGKWWKDLSDLQKKGLLGSVDSEVGRLVWQLDTGASSPSAPSPSGPSPSMPYQPRPTPGPFDPASPELRRPTPGPFNPASPNLRLMPKAPEAATVWATISSRLGKTGMLGLYGLWFEGRKLTPEQEGALKRAFEQYPLGQTNFNAWAKQSLRQVYNNSLRAPVAAA